MKMIWPDRSSVVLKAKRVFLGSTGGGLGRAASRHSCGLPLPPLRSPSMIMSYLSPPPPRRGVVLIVVLSRAHPPLSLAPGLSCQMKKNFKSEIRQKCLTGRQILLLSTMNVLYEIASDVVSGYITSYVEFDGPSNFTVKFCCWIQITSYTKLQVTLFLDT